MRQYQNLLKRILTHGDVVSEPRTQTKTIGISGWHEQYDLREGFPLLTTKKIISRLPFEELFWKLRGESNVKPLFDRNVHIWDANAYDNMLKNKGLKGDVPKHSTSWNDGFGVYKDDLKKSGDENLAGGDLGPVYGYQWRHGFEREGEEIDQLRKMLDGIKKSPGSRYNLMNAWNPSALPDMALGPCPFWHQLSVYDNGEMDLTMVQRSCDSFLGVPFNIAQDALLLEMIANETGFKPRHLEHMTLNTHIYLGVSPRADFWEDEYNVDAFKLMAGTVIKENDVNGFLDLKNWYESRAGIESEGNKRKDHMPFVLEQLSKEPRELPSITIRKDVSLFDAIEMKVGDYVKIGNYRPHEWDCKATMAA
jgi:thymidylate synthase